LDDWFMLPGRLVLDRNGHSNGLSRGALSGRSWPTAAVGPIVL